MPSRNTRDTRAHNTPRALALIGCFVFTAVVATGFAGCGSRYNVAESAYTGPPISIQAAADRHVVVVESPSPGWRVTADHTTPHENASRVFITIRRPDPQFFYTQQIVEQHVATTIRTIEPVEVFARVQDFGTKNRKQPYPRAATSRGTAPPTPPNPESKTPLMPG